MSTHIPGTASIDPVTTPLPIVAFDWSNTHIHYTFDGETVATVSSLSELLDLLEAPHRIVGETTLEAWDRERAFLFDDAARLAGHEVRVFRPIHTARRRPATTVKTDANDVRIIYRIATDPSFHTYPIPRPDSAAVQRRKELNREYGRLRFNGAKPEMAERAEAVLGPYGDLNPVTASVLGNGTKYSMTLLAVLWYTAGKCPTRDEFERAIGLHGSGYPSLLRSDVHHHCYRHARKRGVAWTTYRRELRRTYTLLRTAMNATQPVPA